MGETVEINGEEYNIEIDSFHAGDPGRLYGPPEKCYPPEPPEIEWHADTGCTLTDAAIHSNADLCEEITEKMTEICMGE